MKKAKNKKTSRPRPPKPEPQLLTPENCLDDLSFDLTHDEFFKQTFAMIPFAKAFLRMVLNVVLLLKLELDGLTVVDTTYFDEKFKKYHADIVYKIPLRGGGEVYIHVIIEHKSGETDFETILQLSNYVIQIHKGAARLIKNWNRDTRLHPVIAIIVHHGSSTFTGATELAELIQKLDGADEYQLNMRAILFDLSKVSIDEIPHDVDCPELWPILMMMKTVFSKRDILQRFDEIMKELKPYSNDQHYLRLIRLCVHYVVSCNAQRLAAEDIESIDITIHDTLGEENMIPMNNTIYTTGRAEGRAEGEARGVVMAEPTWRAKERAEKVAELLDLRFEKVPYQLTEKILMMSDLDKLAKLFRFACKCRTIAEFEDGMDS